jgi:hypothetical protein
MYAGIVLQIPVKTCGDVDPRVSPDDGLIALLVQFKEVFV